MDARPVEAFEEKNEWQIVVNPESSLEFTAEILNFIQENNDAKIILNLKEDFFKKITSKESEESKAKAASFLDDKIKNFMLQATKAGLSSIVFTVSDVVDKDEVIKRELKKYFQNIKEIIKKNKITVDVILPSNLNLQAEQKEIDIATSEAVWQRKFKGKPEQDKVEVSLKKRSRPRVTTKIKVQIDTALQDERQEEQQVAKEIAKEKSVQNESEMQNEHIVNGEDEALYDVLQFYHDIKEGKFAIQKHPSFEQAVALWHNWLGALNYQELRYKKVSLSRSACAELLKYQEYYQFGLDLQRLPPGFRVIQGESIYGLPPLKATKIDFDEKNKELMRSKDPLCVQTHDELKRPIFTLTFSQTDELLKYTNDNIKKYWKAISTDSYDRKAVMVFRKLLPYLLLAEEKLQIDILAKIDELKEKNDNVVESYLATIQLVKVEKLEDHVLYKLLDEEQKYKLLNEEKKDIIRKPDGIDYNNLYQLYFLTDKQGFQQAIQYLTNEDKKFSWIKILPDYRQILTKEFNEAIDYVKSLGENDKIWWEKLFKQHREAQPNFSFSDLVSAFRKFKEELNKLSKINGIDPPLQLPSLRDSDLNEIKSLPVALSRILILVKKCDAINQQAQLDAAAGLDLSSNGAIKTVQSYSKQWAFVTPAMVLEAKDEFGKYAKTSLECLKIADDDFSKTLRIAKEKKIKISDDNIYLSSGISLDNKFDNVLIIEGAENPLLPSGAKDLLRKAQRNMLFEYGGIFSKESAWKNFLEIIISCKGLDQLYKHFFRFLATKENVRMQLSLQFYQYVTEELSGKQISYDDAREILIIIAITTVDKNFELAKRSEINCKENFDEFLIKIKENKKWRDILNVIRVKKSNYLPPFPVLTQMMMLANPDEKNQTNFIRLIEFYQTHPVYQHAVYEGLMNYTADDYKANKDILENYLNLVTYLEAQKIDSHLKKSLISLISTFRLSEESVNKLLANYFLKTESNKNDEIIIKALKEALVKHLPYIAENISQKKPFTEGHLISILDSLKEKIIENINESKEGVELSADFVLETMQTITFNIAINDKNYQKVNLKDYFPSAYFSLQLDKNPVAEEINKKIVAKFADETTREAMRKIISQFSGEQEKQGNLMLADKLIDIMRNMLAKDRVKFLTLLQTNNFYKEGKGILRQVDFIAMLTMIDANKEIGLDNFYYLMQTKNSIQKIDKKFDFSALSKKIMNYLVVVRKLDTFAEENEISKELTKKIEKRVQATWLVMPVDEREEKEEKDASLENINLFSSMLCEFLSPSPFKENEILQNALLNLYDNYLENFVKNKKDLIFSDYIFDFFALKDKFQHIKDEKIILSLCFQFNGKQHKEFNPDFLLKIMSQLTEKNCHTVCQMIVSLINNDKTFSYPDLEAILKNEKLLEVIDEFYQKAPFPSIQKLVDWDKDWKKDSDYKEYMNKMYKGYSLTPSPREIWLSADGTCLEEKSENAKPLNGFHKDVASEKLNEFIGFRKENIDLDKFVAITNDVRNKSIKDLVDALNKFKNTTEPDYYTLVAVAAELLYRSKGNDDIDVNGKYKIGSSFELNTTQYLAILTSLMSGDYVTSQIGTGEGKSRIMMVLNACQFALGNTVDFLTSDVQLAKRDYLEYQSYFNLLGAKTAFITANSKDSDYLIDGINFSDPSNMSLFRNKWQSEISKKISPIIHPEPNKRALLLDEADKTYFDAANTRYNYSAAGKDEIKDMDWVYPLLIRYFMLDKDKKRDALYYDDIDASREDFLSFAQNEMSEDESAAKIARLYSLPSAQIEQWQESAKQAMSLRYQVDFTFDPDESSMTPKGLKSEAKLIVENRILKNSKFSFGVHQCLHARLNLLRDAPRLFESERESFLSSLQTQDEKSEYLKEIEQFQQDLKRCKNDFHMDDEKQIIYSSTSKTLLDDYVGGKIKAVTGTAGSEIERAEVSKLHQMNFIDVPRHRGLHRNDHPLYLRPNKEKQHSLLIKKIKQAIQKKQPILVIAENDVESAELYNILNQIKEFNNHIQRISSTESSDEETKKIALAGAAGMITVSTNMIGRGTDIKLDAEAKEKGLHVMLTYLPRPRDYQQIIGRSGRAGDKGETSLLLDKVRLQKQLGIKTLGFDYYADVESYIAREQALMDKASQCERLIKNILGDFRNQFENLIFKEILSNMADTEKKVKIRMLWVNFFAKIDQQWNEMYPTLQTCLQADSINVASIEKIFAAYQEKVNIAWDELRQETNKLSLPIDLNKKFDISSSFSLKLSYDSKEFLQKTITIVNATRTFDRYDSAHDGRAVRYDSWSTWFRISLQSINPFSSPKDGEDVRRFFANTRAWLEGYGVLFANSRAYIAELLALSAPAQSKQLTRSLDIQLVKIESDHSTFNSKEELDQSLSKEYKEKSESYLTLESDEPSSPSSDDKKENFSVVKYTVSFEKSQKTIESLQVLSVKKDNKVDILADPSSLKIIDKFSQADLKNFIEQLVSESMSKSNGASKKTVTIKIPDRIKKYKHILEAIRSTCKDKNINLVDNIEASSKKGFFAGFSSKQNVNALKIEEKGEKPRIK